MESSPATRPPPCMSLPSAYRPLVSSPKLPPSSRAVRENSRCAMAPKIMGSMTQQNILKATGRPRWKAKPIAASSSAGGNR